MTENTRIRAAFPPGQQADVDRVLEILVPDRHPISPDNIGAVTCGGEPLRIPRRVYLQPPSQVNGLNDEQRAILWCIYTRHHDGRVREAAVRALMPSALAWTTPFVIQLVGEYVVEIVELIAKHAAYLAEPCHRRFVNENPQFMALTRQRATSYWDCYYRRRWPNKRGYPSIQVLDFLQLRLSAAVPTAGA